MKHSHSETGSNYTRGLLAVILLFALSAYSHADDRNEPARQQPTSVPDRDQGAEAAFAREPDTEEAAIRVLPGEVPTEPVIQESADLSAESSPAAPAPASMDLDSLESRLRKSKAIGIFTKLELKRQVNDLMRDFDDYHRNRSKLSLAQLEDRFSLLLMKLGALLQDNDPQLHHYIVGARSAIWATLADPDQFAALQGS